MVAVPKLNHHSRSNSVSSIIEILVNIASKFSSKIRSAKVWDAVVGQFIVVVISRS